MARHQHEQHQLIYVSSGVVATRTASGAWIVGPGSAGWVPAGVWHEHRCYGNSTLHTLGFTAGEAPLPAAPAVIPVGSLLRELLVAYTGDGVAGEELRHLRTVILDRLHGSGGGPLLLPQARDPRLACACRLAVADLQQPLSLDQIAVGAGTSTRTLSRLFRSELGMTYPQWRSRVRIFHAMIDPTAGVPVTETAYRNGWATVSAFIDTFTRVTGCTPGRYRRQ
ncbi:AraC family transcriptional regulator [Amycolatopsis sp. lyj-23]|uniref:AraC family transcriptional regulator n=1 Tax=Amycolatopsis sp. lyj-23 TaxID=2789283 RepID=UPI00397A4153